MPTQNTVTESLNNAPTFPIVYAMEVNAPNGAGEFRHGDLLVFNSIEEPVSGDLVCVHPRKGMSVLVVLAANLGFRVWERMPYREHPGSDVRALLSGHILGTDRILHLKCEDLWAVHKCDGRADPAACGR
jgi:hypothetical protein